MNPSASTAALRAGAFEIRLAERQLLIDAQPAKLGARAFDLLAALVERRERTVSKNELLDIVWPGVVVEENNLQVQISTLRKLLGPQTIATIPGRGYRFTAAIQGQQQPADEVTPPPTAELPAASGAVGNLPIALPELIGRDAEQDALGLLLDRHRLVTVTGAGGIGKTRLAVATAHALRARWDDGVWFAELAALNEGAQVPGTVAQAMQLALPGRGPVLDELTHALRDARLLLVLDNCEHLLGGCAELATRLLEHAPGAQVLATSQEPLHLAEEHLFRLDPLAVLEPAGDGDPDAPPGGALALFLARARAAQPRLSVDPPTLKAAVDICRRLDGLPLAIEMAAARVPLLGVQGVRARLDERLRLLATGAASGPRRHQTMRAALEWSHGLLGKPEQAVFRRLAIFAGGFVLEAAQAVAADGTLDGWDVVDRLGALVDKSLVVADAGDAPRYRLLETARAFALERLRDAGEAERIAALHAQAICALFERSAREEWTSTPSERADRYLPEMDNLRAAWDWAASAPGQGPLLLRLAAATAWAWSPANAALEGVARVDAALAHVDAQTSPGLAAPALLARAIVHRYDFGDDAAHAAMRRAAGLFRELGDHRDLFKSLLWLARKCAKRGDHAQARERLAEAEALLDPSWPRTARRLWLHGRATLSLWEGRLDDVAEAQAEILASAERDGDEDAQLQARGNLADNALARGDLEQAIHQGRAVVALRERRRGLGQGASLNFARANLAAALTRAGRFDEALETARQAVGGLVRSGDAVYFIEHFAALAIGLGRPADAARALACSVGMTGHPREINEQRALDETLAALRASVDDATLQRWFDEGKALGAENASYAALDLQAP